MKFVHRTMLWLVMVILPILTTQTFAKSYHVKIHQAQITISETNQDTPGNRDGDSICTIISDSPVKTFRGLKHPDELHIVKRPAIQAPVDEDDNNLLTNKDQSFIVEIFGHDRDTIQGHIDTICKFTKLLDPLPPPQPAQVMARTNEDNNNSSSPQPRAPEVIQIVHSGDSGNRIDVVFMGDGYTASQRQQFIDDIERLTKDMFEGETFRSYLPLFNIWAIYDESVDEGIGYNGAQNTPFRLYREQGQLRVIYPGNPTYARQVCALTGQSGCDYPSLIGNDDFYGGLGGEFVVSTKSTRTGTIVLRHEMGHNFAQVGDEYDNSPTYYGVNSATTVNNLGWTHWLTGNQREERAMYRLLAYPWADLAAGQQSFTFTSDGAYSRWYCLVSVSAAGEADSLEFRMDGEILPWNTTGYDDREFYNWKGNQGFSAGSHTFTVRSKTPSTHPKIPRMIASINIHEYGSESEFVVDNDHISAYPTWGEAPTRRKTLRPTNEGCLMRNITQARFCNVCKEGMWYQFLARVSLIDDVEVYRTEEGGRAARVDTLQLGQLRPIGDQIDGEQLQIRWTFNGVEQDHQNDQFDITNILPGNWRVTVTLVTPEVRVDPNGLLTDTQTFVVPN